MPSSKMIIVLRFIANMATELAGMLTSLGRAIIVSIIVMAAPTLNENYVLFERYTLNEQSQTCFLGDSSIRVETVMSRSSVFKNIIMSP